LKQTPPAYHGALDYVELEQLGLDPETILDFSVNSNPYGPSPLVGRALAGVPLERYPDREALALRRALAGRLDLDPAQLVVGNGAAELLWLIAFTFLGPADPVLVIGPTFGEYSRLASLVGGRVSHWQAQAADHFALNLAEISQRLATLQPRLTFLCNPNNPTGVILPAENIAAWVERFPQTLFVIDEAYLPFAPGLASALTIAANNILLVRSMTKDYALAGLRLGYALSRNKALVEVLALARPAWNVNALAQAAGLAALGDDAHHERSLAQLRLASQQLRQGLVDAGFWPHPSATHYFLLPVNDAVSFRRTLLQQGLLVRDCASFGLPDYVRIATRRPAENERLLAAVRGLTGASRPVRVTPS
jgi:histidinol-phosphate aminotransferase